MLFVVLRIAVCVVLEKAKQALEAENADLATELKSAAAARAEGERRRKQAEAQLADLAAKLQDVDRSRYYCRLEQE